MNAKAIAYGSLLCVALFPVASHATGHDLAKELKGKVLLLRAMESGDKLAFDAQGNLIGANTPEPFAYSAIEIKKIKEGGPELQLKCQRVALFFDTSSQSPALKDIRFVPLNEPVEITIALDQSSPDVLPAVLGKIFAIGPQSALSGKSPAEEAAELETLGSFASLENPLMLGPTPDTGIYQPGAGVSPPRLVHSADPVIPSNFRHQGFQGICVLSAVVDTSGRPTHIRLVTTDHQGLDLSAIAAVSQYRFTPAEFHGKQVRAYIQIAVNYRVR